MSLYYDFLPIYIFWFVLARLPIKKITYRLKLNDQQSFASMENIVDRNNLCELKQFRYDKITKKILPKFEADAHGIIFHTGQYL